MSLFNSLLAFGVSADCPNVINLARGLNMHLVSPSTYAALSPDCCVGTLSTSPWVVCVASRVTQINWDNNLYLNGTINSTAIPSSLTYLDLGWNYNIKGSFPTLPSGMQYLNLHSNGITGTIPSPLPAGLQYLDLNTMSITGSLPSQLPSGMTDINVSFNYVLNGTIPALPSTLQNLNIGLNAFTGPFPSVLPSGLLSFYAHQNLLSGCLPASLPSGMQALDVSANIMWGIVPILLLSITVLHLGWPGTSSNQFLGNLTLLQPTEVYINNNLITNLVIYDSSKITLCNIDWNPLLGNKTIPD